MIFSLILLLLSLSPFSLAKTEGVNGHPICLDNEKHVDFSNGIENTGLKLKSVDASRFQTVEISGTRKFALKSTWQVGDYASNGFRSEVADDCLPPEHKPILYTLSFFIPKEFNLEREKSLVLAQFHTPDSLHKPQIAFRYRANGNFDITLNHLLPSNPNESPRSLQKKPVTVKNLRRGHWHQISMLINWSSRTDLDLGLLAIRLNDRPVLLYRGQNNFTDQNSYAPFFKFGVYPHDGNSHDLTLYHSDYRRSINPSGEQIAEFMSSFTIDRIKAFENGDEKIILDDSDN